MSSTSRGAVFEEDFEVYGEVEEEGDDHGEEGDVEAEGLREEVK